MHGLHGCPTVAWDPLLLETRRSVHCQASGWLEPVPGVFCRCRAGTLFTERGTIVTVFIVCYALTSFVAGYIRCAGLLIALLPAALLKG